MKDFNVTAGGRLCAALQRLTDEVLSGDLPSVQAAYEVQRTLVAAGAQQAPLPQGQTQSPGTPLLPEILSLFTSSIPVPSSSVLTAFARAAAQKDRIAALPLPSREALEANRKRLEGLSKVILRLPLHCDKEMRASTRG